MSRREEARTSIDQLQDELVLLAKALQTAQEERDAWEKKADVAWVTHELQDQLQSEIDARFAAEARITPLGRMVATAGELLIDLIPQPCLDHDCPRHAWWDPECKHAGCTALLEWYHCPHCGLPLNFRSRRPEQP